MINENSLKRKVREKKELRKTKENEQKRKIINDKLKKLKEKKR